MNSELIKKYFKGECTPGEAFEFLQWLHSKNSEIEISKSLEGYWEELDDDLPNKPEMLNKIHHLIDENEIKANRYKQNGPGLYLKIAAAISLLFLVSYFIFINNKNHQIDTVITEIVAVEKSTEAGQKRTIKLPDGSMVTLNANSKLTYSQGFADSDSNRIVSLIGEAFFEVQKDKKPFIVKANNVSIKVLGTSFNIRNHSQEEKVKVALLSGSVKINTTQSDSIELVPGELMVYDRSEKTYRKKRWNYQSDFGWKDGIIDFQKATIYQIKKRLQEWYGVEIHISGDGYANRHYTGSFQNQSLENVLQSLSFTFGFNYQIKEKMIYVKF